jgi:hypothetical protein
LEQALELLEQVSERIGAGITRIGCQNFNRKYQYFEISGAIVWVIENLIAPLDRARRVVLGTAIGTLGTGSWTNRR